MTALPYVSEGYQVGSLADIAIPAGWLDRDGERVMAEVVAGPPWISAYEKTRIVTLPMRAGCEPGLKFDDEFCAALRFAAFSGPSWIEAA